MKNLFLLSILVVTWDIEKHKARTAKMEAEKKE